MKDDKKRKKIKKNKMTAINEERKGRENTEGKNKKRIKLHKEKAKN